MKSIKQKLIITCQLHYNEKINSLRLMLHDVTEAGNNETKSTAGDKHETGRAMMQLEQEKLGKQLYELEQQFQEFDKIDFSFTSTTISLGSLVETTKGLFLIATSIGKIELSGKTVFVISNKSPLASALIGKSKNDVIHFNTINYNVLGIY